MKKMFLIAGLVMVASVLIGVGNRSISLLEADGPAKKTCVGFTVIEAGKGINCYGDTIRLAKRNGFYTAAK